MNSDESKKIDPDFEDWLLAGVKNGWCGPPVCSTHDGLPMSEEEYDDNNQDACIHILRLYEDRKTKKAVEKAHLPSVWRATDRGLR